RSGAVDRAFDGTFDLIIPFIAFFVVAQASGRRNLRDMAWRAARYGVARRDVALGILAIATVAAAGLSALAALSAVLVASSSATGSLARDALQGMWIAALVSAAYV